MLPNMLIIHLNIISITSTGSRLMTRLVISEKSTDDIEFYLLSMLESNVNFFCLPTPGKDFAPLRSTVPAFMIPCYFG